MYIHRKENADVKVRLQEQDDVILGLRRDLAGASARLSDITGNCVLNAFIEKNNLLNKRYQKNIVLLYFIKNL
jgi:hypothetical protein